MTATLGIVLGVYLLVLFGLSVFASTKVHDEEDYIVAGRRLPLWLAWGTLLATWFGAATVTGAAEAARNEGLRGTIVDPFASGLALIVAGLFFARRLWEMKLLTVADFYGRQFGNRAEVVAGVILIPGYFGWIGAQYKALGGLLETFFGPETGFALSLFGREFVLDATAGIWLSAGVILLYTLVGGMWSVTLTDTLQMFVILITLVILAAVTFSHLGGGSIGAGLTRLVHETDGEKLTLLPQAGLAAAVAWTATWASGVLGNIPGQDLTQRIFASKDATTAKRACLLAGAVYILFGLLPVGMGLASRILVPDDPEGKTLGVLAREFLTPLTASIFIVALVSVIVSTATSAVLAPACILAHNLIGRLVRYRRGAAIADWSRTNLLIDRLSVLAVTAGGVAAAFSDKSILDLLEMSLSIVVVTLFVPLVAGLFGKVRSERAALWAMAAGLVVWLGRELLEGIFLPLSPAAAQSGMLYADFVRNQSSPALYVFALFPSAISGTAASALAYWLAGRATRDRQSQ